MTINASMHSIATMEARNAEDLGWLHVEAKDGLSYITIFMSREEAEEHQAIREKYIAIEAEKAQSAARLAEGVGE